MSGPIQTIPQGLLGLLQLKELGRNPGQLVDTVAPNIDLGQYYLERLQQGSGGLFGGTPQTAAIGNAGHGLNAFLIGGGPQAQVPQNETWFVTHVGTYIEAGPGGGNTVVAADTVRAAVAWAAASGSDGPYPITPATNDFVSARARTWATDPLVRPMFIPPGALFWLDVFDINVAAGGYNFGLVLRAARIPI